MKATLKQARQAVRDKADPTRAKGLQRFFKTGPGEYAEGDIFLGLTVPEVRAVARCFSELSLGDLKSLLSSKFHEERLLALVILTERFARSREAREHREIVAFYLANLKHINNWDLVDASAAQILGASLEARRSRATLQRLARSRNLWRRRIAIVSTFHFIRNGESRETLRIAKMLLHDDEDLIHKVTGWMLREVGKRVGKAPLRGFLNEHAAEMPRTMLRYALEHFSAQERQVYMKRH